MKLVLACAIAASAAASAYANRVSVDIMVESFCPCSGAWEAGFAADLLPKIGDIVELTRFFDAKANGTQHCCNPSAGKITQCMHRKTECVANSLQQCVQEHYPAYGQWLDFTNCINGPCVHQPGTPKVATGCQYQYEVGTTKSSAREQECARNLTMDWDVINTCWMGDEGVALAQKDADKSDAIEERYGLTGLPVVWVGGKLVSKFFDCGISKPEYQQTLLAAICDAFTGAPLPEACAQVAHIV